MNNQVKQTCYSECSSEVIFIKISKDFTVKRRVPCPEGGYCCNYTKKPLLKSINYQTDDKACSNRFFSNILLRSFRHLRNVCI